MCRTSTASPRPAHLISLMPDGFAFIESGANGDSAYAASMGSLSVGNTYSFGTDGDRALGEITSEAVQSIFGACFVNNTGYPISRIAVGFAAEQWRLGAADGVSDRLSFQYSIDASDLTSGTWVTVYNYVSRINEGPVGAIIGNHYQSIFLPSLRTLTAAVPEGGKFFVRWVPADIPGEDDGLAIDYFNLRTFPTADFDKDGNVDGADLLIWQRYLGTVHDTLYEIGDATGDTRVNNADLNVWKRQFDRPPSSTVAVPEPSGLSRLVALAMILQLKTACSKRRTDGLTRRFG